VLNGFFFALVLYITYKASHAFVRHGLMYLWPKLAVADPGVAFGGGGQSGRGHLHGDKKWTGQAGGLLIYACISLFSDFKGAIAPYPCLRAPMAKSSAEGARIEAP
jgi:hypothetical protein